MRGGYGEMSRHPRQGINPQAESQSSLKAAILPPDPADLVPMLCVTAIKLSRRSFFLPQSGMGIKPGAQTPGSARISVVP